MGKKSSNAIAANKNGNGKKGSNFLARLFSFKASYFNTVGLVVAFFSVFLLGILIGFSINNKPNNFSIETPEEYWLVLERGENKEYLYFGTPGEKEESRLVKEFDVKTGIPGERPTPLPLFLGKKYWKIVKKYPSYDNPETSPYFLELDIPVEGDVFGPVPYPECNGQCNWELPGAFGLHGVNGDMSKLSTEDPGSSGCIRHSDDDIAYLYNLLEVDEGVRYYINP